MNVLIVDGSARVRTRLGARFAEEGVDVIQSPDLDTALVLLRDHEVSAIVLDLHTQSALGEPGVAALLELRREAPRAVLVVLATETSELVHAECKKHGADFVFEKAREFERAVETVLWSASMTAKS